MVLVRSGVRYQRVHAGSGPGWIRNNLDLHAIAILLVVECKRNAAHWSDIYSPRIECAEDVLTLETGIIAQPL